MNVPARRLLPWAGAVAAVLLAAVILAFSPPKPLLQATAKNWLPPDAQWSSVGHDRGLCFIRDLEVPGRPAGFKAVDIRLTHSLLVGALSGEWRFEAERASLAPADPRWPELVFRSGRGRWVTAARRLELRDWTSDQARVDADLEWDAAGRIRLARIRGDADPSNLRKALGAWKMLKLDESAPHARLPFELFYQKGELLIRVNDKPFFKASWRSDGAF